MEDKNAAKDILNMLSKAMSNKIYGSIEVYLEAGSITQVTQRIIRKITKPKKATPSKVKYSSSKHQEEDISSPILNR